MILALEYHRSPTRFLAARGMAATKLGSRMSGVLAGNVAPLRLVNRPDPDPAGDGWVRLRTLLSGICGSDLGLLTGRSSPYLSPMISMPFVPGHEVLAETMDDLPDLPAGSRVVIDPVLGCAARGLPACRWCAAGQTSRCDQVTGGRVSAGLQTGFCAGTGGGWSQRLTAHRSQLHPVPGTLPDDRALLVEPLACAVHSVRRISIPVGASVLVVGAGTVGLLTLLALRAFTQAGPVYVIGKYPEQRARAKELDATDVFEPRRAVRAVRRATGGFLQSPEWGPEFLLGGADIAFECTGGTAGLDTALRLVRAGGTVVVSGMPSGPVDVTPLWYRELQLVGAYASGNDTSNDPDAANASDAGNGAGATDFTEAIELAAAAPLDGYVDATYPLGRWREAISHATSAGRLGGVKVAFDPTKE